jgi:hypothetical protein
MSSDRFKKITQVKTRITPELLEKFKKLLDEFNEENPFPKKLDMSKCLTWFIFMMLENPKILKTIYEDVFGMRYDEKL